MFGDNREEKGKEEINKYRDSAEGQVVCWETTGNFIRKFW